MVAVQRFLRFTQVFFHLAALVPWHLNHPFDVAAHDRRFRRHRRHHFQLLQLGFRFFARLFRHFGRFDFTLQRFIFVRRVIHFAQLFLNRLHLLIQIVFALAFFHLFFDAVTDAFLNLQQVNLRLHHRHQIFQTFINVGHFQHGLLIRQLKRHMRSHGIGQTRGVVNAVQRGQYLRRNFFIEFDIAFKLIDSRTNQHFLLALFNLRRYQIFRLCGKVLAIVGKLGNACALQPFHQHFYRAVRQLQHLQNRGNGPYREEIVNARFIR